MAPNLHRYETAPNAPQGDQRRVDNGEVNILYYVIIIFLSYLFFLYICLDCKGSYPSAKTEGGGRGKGSDLSPGGG